MSDPILLFLAVDAVVLLMLGACAAVLPLAACGFLITMAGGLGMLLCLPPLLITAPVTTLAVPVGPPGMSLHLALDPLSAGFLVIVLLAGTATAAFQATSVPLVRLAAVRMTAFGLAGMVVALLAADGITLALGAGAVALARSGYRNRAALPAPLLLLAAIFLLTQAGDPPRFDVIRASPIDPNHATAAALLTLTAVVALSYSRPVERCWSSDALTTGVVIPGGGCLLLRVIFDLGAGAARTGCGFALLLLGGALALAQGWRAGGAADIDASVRDLTRRQAGLAMTGIGLGLIARTADLPGAEGFALAATFLTAIGACVAGVLTVLAVQAIGVSAGSHRLSRLGGLIHTMPGASAALSAGLLGLSALPPGVGFASLWLLLQAVLSAPRTGGLLLQLPLALSAASIAGSAALAATASVRLIGVGLLGRPRTPRGAGASETRSPPRTVLLVLAGLSLVAGILPGPVLRLMADRAIHGLTGAQPNSRLALALLVPSAATPPGYLALPVLALVGAATVAAMLFAERSNKESKTLGAWMGGMTPPAGLPFGEPDAQSAGEGFLPALPAIPLPGIPKLTFVLPSPVPASAVLWLVLAAWTVLLLVLAVTA